MLPSPMNPTGVLEAIVLEHTDFKTININIFVVCNNNVTKAWMKSVFIVLSLHLEAAKI